MRLATSSAICAVAPPPLTHVGIHTHCIIIESSGQIGFNCIVSAIFNLHSVRSTLAKVSNKLLLLPSSSGTPIYLTIGVVLLLMALFTLHSSRSNGRAAVQFAVHLAHLTSANPRWQDLRVFPQPLMPLECGSLIVIVALIASIPSDITAMMSSRSQCLSFLCSHS